ncbi:MAG TPA: YihY/virulence factor BrkB family protein [Streptosporangiaceae bacterium]
MKPLRKIIAALDAWQRRGRAGVPYAVVKKFGDDNANLQVLALAWYGFTAIFPLLLVVVTIFGFIGQESLGSGVVTTLHKFPVVGTQFQPTGGEQLHGSTVGLVIGLLGLIYGAQGVTQSAQQAMAMVWNVPQTRFTGFLPRLGRSLAGLITIGGTFLVNAALSTYATGGTSNYAIRVPVLAGLLVVNTVLYFATFYVLTPKVVGPRGLIPGSILGSIGLTALLTVGTGLLTHQLANASNTYGTFGGVIGIVAILLLLAKVSIYAAELNPVLSRSLYPRALPMVDDPTSADFRVLSDLAHAQQRRPDQVIGVGFGENAVADAAADARKQARARPQS